MSIPVSNSEVKKQWSNTSTFSYALMTWCLSLMGTSVPFGSPSIARGGTETGMVESAE